MQQLKLQSVTVVITALVLDVLADALAVPKMKWEKQQLLPLLNNLSTYCQNS